MESRTSTTSSSSSSSSSSFPGFFQDHQHSGRFNLLRWKSGKSADPRLVSLLESFGELFNQRREFFKKIFPGIYDEFVELFGKFGAALSDWKDGVRVRNQTMQRSLSFGSPRTGEDSELRLERFNIRTPDLFSDIGAQPAGSGQGSQSSQGDTKSIATK